MQDRGNSAGEAEWPTTWPGAIREQSVVDMHTHLYPPSFGTPMGRGAAGAAIANGLLLWGIDELLT